MKDIDTEKIFNLKSTYSKLPKIFYSEQKPDHVPKPRIVALNYTYAKELGINAEELKSDYGVEVLSGNKIIEGSNPISQAYAGHQFGYFTMLGDGRAVLLGEHLTKNGEIFDIQLKGAGRTIYSRGGDGKAALGPMLREYIISEGMKALNIPTTRSLAVLTTGEEVIREKILQGALLVRVAKSHLRVGTFEYAARWGDFEDLKALADYAIDRHYKYISKEIDKYTLFLKEVVNNQASLIAKWQLVGFIHGVMNTDNMTISGETIDYGPCAFMDTYNPRTVFSSIDTNGRYAYENQPNIGVWNLARFAESILPLLSKNQDEAVKIAEKEVLNFNNLYNSYYISGMRKKLGIFNEEKEDDELIKLILNIMEENEGDYTNTFRILTTGNIDELEFNNKEEFKNWYDKWQERLSRQNKSKEEIRELMESNNPYVIPRNHRVEEALEAANNNDYSVMDSLLKVISNPYDYSKVQEEYTKVHKEFSCGYKTYCGT